MDVHISNNFIKINVNIFVACIIYVFFALFLFIAP